LLWEEANLGEPHRILMTMLDGLYADTVEEKAIAALKPKPAFQACSKWLLREKEVELSL